MAQLTAAPGFRVDDGLEVPQAGTYEVDRAHSMVGFVARYLMVTKVRGQFEDFSGRIHIAENPLESWAEVTVQAASLQTHDQMRDGHVRGEDFLDVENHPTVYFRSTRVQPSGRNWKLIGDLTVRGVTSEVAFDLEFDGVATDPWGGSRIAFSASTELDREEFGVTWNAALETGGVLVGRNVTIDLAIQAIKQA